MASKCAIILFIVVALYASSICCNADSVLGTLESLNTEDSLRSRNNDYVLTMQSDCNLVLYDKGFPVWATNTHNLARNCKCTLQRNGNLVVSSPQRTIWTSNTGRGRGNYVLVLQRDRNLVIYGNPIWATNTHVASSAPIFIPKVIHANRTDSIIKTVASV